MGKVAFAAMSDTSSQIPKTGPWVSRELGEELDKALKNLETYSESRDKRDYLTATRQLLLEIRGVLNLTGHQPLALLAGDMETLLEQHLRQPGDNADEVLNVMAEGMLGLSDAVRKGGYGLISLIDQLNQIRAQTNVDLASESEIFVVQLDQGLKAFSRNAEKKLDVAALGKLRVLYQKLLPGLLAGESDKDQLAKIQQIFKAMHQLSGRPVVAATGYVGLVVLREVQQVETEMDKVLKLQFERLGAYLGRLAEDPAAEDIGLLKNLLFCLLKFEQHSDAARQIIKVFGLEQALDQRNTGSSVGFDPQLVSQVAGELQSEINQTKLWLDDAVSGVGDFAQTVRQINSVFKRVADTMMMLGVNSSGEAVEELNARLDSWQELDSISEVSTDDLQWFADHLVDLEEEIGHLSRTGSSNQDGRQSNEFNAALGVIVAEGRQTLSRVKQSVNQYVSSSSASDLTETPRQLQHLEGALRFYPLPRIADMVRGARRFIGEKLIAEGAECEQEQIELLADVVVAVDYYLECLEQGTAENLDFLVERALDDCAQLGYPEGEAGAEPKEESDSGEAADVVEAPEASEAPDQVDVSAEDESAQTDAPGEEIEAPTEAVDEAQTQEVEAEAETTDAEPEVEPVSTDEEEDDEILAIFAEEAEELLPEASENYSSWCRGSDEAMADLRRAFHTLKGGGRMVGAVVVGELSWAMENLLNKVMDGTVNAGQAVMQVVGEALDAMPGLLEAMKSGDADSESEQIASLRETADMLANPSAVRSELSGAGREKETSAEPELSNDVEDQTADETDVTAGEQEQTIEPDETTAESPEVEAPLDLQQQLEEISKQADEESQLLNRAIRCLGHLLAHFEFVGEPASEESAKLVAELGDLASQSPPDEEALQGLFEKSASALAEAEARMVAAADGDRAKRYRPLSRLLEDEIGSLLDFNPVISAWQSGELNPDQMTAIQDDLQVLSEAASLADVQPLRSFCVKLGELLDILPQDTPISDQTASLLNKCQEALIGMLDCVASGERIVDPPSELLAEIDQAMQPPELEPSGFDEPEEEADSAPQDQVEDHVAGASEDITSTPGEMVDEEDEFDRELLETFIEEAEDLQSEVGEALSAWQGAHDQFEHADAIHRALHTLKGGARLSGLEHLGTMSHDFESIIIDRQVMRSVDDVFFDECFRHYDGIVGEIERVKTALGSGANLVELKSAPSSETTEEPAMQVTPLPDMPPRQSEEPAESTEPESEGQQEAASKERREQFRVEAELLDKMVNLAGEAIVFRGRIEAQVSGFDTILDELEGTTDRIQSLSRRLDGETQAQILFRREQIAEAGEEEEFDPLEMDRYSLLQQLSHQLIEAASDLQDLRSSLSETSREAKALLLQNSRIQTELNDRLMDTRMVPFSRIVPRLQRMTRQIGGELGKKIKLDVGLVEGEMDRQVLDQILSPLEHILRNAIDHGIESEADREAAGKDATGVIGLDVKRDGAHMVMRISDDGRGVDVQAVRRKAIENGLVDESKVESMDEKSLLDLIFAPGFSTARELTQISGRGVGMDVVRSKVRELGGSVEIESEPGKGTTFKLYLPFTLSVNRALMVRISDDIYALPLSSLEALVRVSKDELAKYYADPDRHLIYGPSRYRYGYLGEYLYTLAKPELESIEESSIPLVLFRSGEHAMAIQVDEILGSQEVVVKSLGRPLHDVPGVAGAAIMGDGSVVVTLDMFTLLQTYDRRRAEDAQKAAHIEEPLPESRAPVIMVVDDSVTVRKVTSRFLVREGFLVETARDGVEALRQVHEQKPDLMLVDLEMPRMDGFELLSALRSTDRFADLPVFIITSRTGEKHRERGLELGAQRYFGKPYREEEVVEAITEVLGLDARRKFKS